MFENFWNFFKSKRNTQLDKIEKSLTNLQLRVQGLEEQSVACLHLLHEEIKKGQTVNKGMKSALDLYLKHSNEIKLLQEVMNDHAGIINNNMEVLNDHLKNDHEIQLINDPSQTIHDVLKHLKPDEPKKGRGNN